MSDIGKNALKTKIDNKVYENSSQAITGTIMNEVLQDMVDTLADGGNLDAGSVNTANIADGAVTDAKLQNPVSVSQNTSTATDGNGTISLGDSVVGKYAGADKLVKLVAFVETQASLNVGDIYYNTIDKAIRKKTGDGTADTIPFYYGAIYTYNDELYVWNGTDLVVRGAEMSVTPNPSTGHADISISGNTTTVAGVDETDVIKKNISTIGFDSIFFGYGQLSESTGEVAPQFQYRATSSLISAKKWIILVNPIYEIRLVCYYDLNGDYLNYEANLGQVLILDGTKQVRFSVKKVNEESSHPNISLFSSELLNAVISDNVTLGNTILDVKHYAYDDYKQGEWYEMTNDNKIAGQPYATQYPSIFLPVSKGDIIIVEGRGWVSGRMWYTLNHLGIIQRCAAENFNGRNTIVIGNDEVVFVAQSNSSVADTIIARGTINKSESRFGGKRVSILGDSISSYGTPNSKNENGLYCWSYYPSATCRYSEDGTDGDSFTFDVNNMWWAKVLSKIRATLAINESYRGTFICDTVDTNKGMASQSRINHLGYLGAPDVIMIYGGTNDIGSGRNVQLGTFNTDDPSDYTDEQIAALDTSTFANAVRAMFIRIMKTYPLSKVMVILPTFSTNYGNINRLDSFIEVLKEACDFFGVQYVDIRTCGINPFNKDNYLLDGVHPNTMCMNVIANCIVQQIK